MLRWLKRPFMHPWLGGSYGPLPLGASAVVVMTQTLRLGFAIMPMVLLQPQVAGLTPATVASHATPTTHRKSFTAANAAAPTTISANEG